MMFTKIKDLFCVFVLLCLVGCASYKLGPTGDIKAGERSIQIMPFQNQTMEPRLTDYITMALRNRFQQDGTYRLATQNDGDYLLSGKIIDLTRSGISYNPNDLVTMRDYRLRVTVQISLIDRSTGKTISQKNISAHTVVLAGSDMASAERQALPVLSDELARNVVTAITEGGW